jgi:hypothetical protein
MSRANKRDTELRAVLETIGAELAILRRTMPVTQLRIQQARKRADMDDLLSPAIEEIDMGTKSIIEIGKQVSAGLMLLKGGG